MSTSVSPMLTPGNAQVCALRLSGEEYHISRLTELSKLIKVKC